jgi:hypothetical protein
MTGPGWRCDASVKTTIEVRLRRGLGYAEA